MAILLLIETIVSISYWVCMNPLQKSLEHIASSYQANSNDKQRVCIITGSNSGIGFETAKAIGLAGYHTILACRNPARGKDAVEKLRMQTGLDNFEYMNLNLASFKSINSFIKDFKERNLPLNLLINNAGVAMCPYTETMEGIEVQFGVNHVGHFILTLGLLNIIKESTPARIIFVSAIGNYMIPFFDYDSIVDKWSYDRFNNYFNSKLANVTFANALARKLKNITGVTVNSLHPGSVSTNLDRHIVRPRSILKKLESYVTLDAKRGALTSIFLALSPKVEGVSGKYFAYGKEVRPHPLAESKEEQDLLWAFTEKMVQVHSESK